MRIFGTFTTLSPLMIGAPGESRITLGGHVAPKGQGFPGTRVATMRLPALANDGEDPKPMTVPVISANTLRGAMRRAGATLIEEALIARGETITLPAYHSLRCGSPYGHPDSDPPSVTEIQLAQEMPPMAVFGGGPRMIESALRVDTGFPVLQPLIDRGIVDPRLGASAMSADEHWKLTAWLFRRRNDDAGTFVDHDLAQHVVGSYQESIDAWQTLMAPSEKKAKKGGGVDEADGAADGPMRGVASFTALQVVLPGTVFSFGLDLATEHPASVGYAIKALAGFANAQRVGGYARLGFGRFRLQVSTRVDGRGVEVLVLENGVYRPNTECDDIAAAVDAADEWLGSVAAADIEAMMQPSARSLAKVRAKVKKNRPDDGDAFDQVFGAA